MKKNILIKAFAAVALGCASASASDMGLQGFSPDDIRASQSDVRVPAAQVETGGDMLGVDMTVRVPFKLLKKAAVQVAAPGSGITLLDPSAPVVYKSGDFVKIGNIRVNSGGIIVEPTITLKPYLEARDRLAVKVQRVQVHASMTPSRSGRAAPELSQEDIMAQVMDAMVKSVYSSLDATLKAKKLPLRAQDVVSMRYDKAAWILHVAVSSKVMYQFVPADMVGAMHLTGFSFSDTGIAMKIQTLN